jgi:trigger factor
MKTEVIDISPTRKELRIEIDAERIRAELDRVSSEFARYATVPGFRRGRAPQAIVRQRFKKEIRGEVLGELIPRALGEALQQQPFSVIGEPQLRFENAESLEQLGAEPLAIHAAIEVLPEIALGQYKGLELARRTRPVKEEEIDEVIASMREASSSLVPVEDRGAQAGDIVTVNFRGRFVNEPEAEEIKVDEVDVQIGDEETLPEFTENLMGVRPDEERTFKVKYPENFKASGLAGKEVEYTAQIIAVRRKEMPELDDEWARSMGEGVNTLEELRERIRERLASYARDEAERRLRDEAMQKLLATHQFEAPKTLVQQEMRQLFEATIRRMIELGLDPRNPEIKWDEIRATLEKQAEENVRAELLLERIAEAEGIAISDEEIEEEIKRLAQAAGEPVERVRAALTKSEAQPSIASGLRQRKAMNLIIENAIVRDEEWREDGKADSPEPSPSEAQTADQTSNSTTD